MFGGHGPHSGILMSPFLSDSRIPHTLFDVVDDNDFNAASFWAVSDPAYIVYVT